MIAETSLTRCGKLESNIDSQGKSREGSALITLNYAAQNRLCEILDLIIIAITIKRTVIAIERC